ncbi:hypothetical protein F4009_13535 [Candidatus Poribacteria bacterium]|nr:hypothetical protein [Candidatus Poribacteria bacterium]MYH83191.1 hypothetical protein [Candidatus Poribacteria bacterium]MYK94997.1 hypothetical protein [Candidatus Poribacteria bacterium]
MEIRSRWRQDNYENIRTEMQPGDVIAFSGTSVISTVIKLVTSSHVSHVGIIVPPDYLEDDDAGDGIVVAEATESGIGPHSLSTRWNDNTVENLWWLPLRADLRTRLEENWENFRQYLSDYNRAPYDYLQGAMLGLMLLEPTLDSVNSNLYERIRQFIENILNHESGADRQEHERSILRSLRSMLRQSLNDVDNDSILTGLLHLLLEDDTTENLSRRLDNEEDFEHFFCSEFVTGALRSGGVTPNINPSEITPIELCRFNIYEDNYTQFKRAEATRIRGFNCVDISRWEG